MSRRVRRFSVAFVLSLSLLASVAAHAQPTPGLCDPEPSNTPRPYWPEVAPTLGTGYPDYQNVTSNLQILESIQLLASVATPGRKQAR